VNKTLVYLAATPLLLAPLTLGAGAASAQEATTEGSVANLADVLGISETEASAGSGSGSASAGTVTVGEEPLVDGVTGGTQEGTGSTSGSIVQTGDTPLGSATVGGYDARVVEGNGGTTSSSSATLLEATLVDEETVTLEVLSSESTASSSGSSSSTDGIVLNVGGGDLEVVLLHSESGTQDGDAPFVASVNGETLLSSEQGDGCVVDGGPLVQVLCVTAQEGQTTIDSESAIADVQVVEDRLFVTVGGTSSGNAEEVPAEEESDANSAEAAALLIPDVLGVSETEATAGESASAGVVTVGGDPLIEGLTGGTQEGEGTTEGSVLSTGTTPLGSLDVAPYEATVEGEESRSSASVLEATVVNGETLAVDVLSSESQAGPDGSQSSTQGVVVNLGGGQLEVVLLDSTANGEGEGSATVATVNGQPVASSDQAGDCVLDADPLAQVACVTAEQGATTIETDAAIADVELVDDQLVVTVGGSGAQAGSGQSVSQQGTVTSGGASQGNGSGAGSSNGTGSGSGNGGSDVARASALPLTGSDLTLVALAGLGIIAVGAGVLVAGRRTGGLTV
jgi:hypothetical protein